MPQFIYFIRPARPDFAPENATAEEQQLAGLHFNYLKAAHEAGRVHFVGRTMEDPLVGIAVFDAEDQADAERFTNGDPGISGGMFKATTQPFAVVFTPKA